MRQIACWMSILLLLLISCGDDKSTTPTGDTAPPSRVTDLALFSATTTSVTVIWTAPGDDGVVGKASEYDLRYALAAITEENWSNARRVEPMAAPRSGGSREGITITGLEPVTPYFFALKTADEVPNWSQLSNLLSESTASLLRLTTSTRQLGAYSAAWSPDGQSIAFQADWERMYYPQLYLIPANGGQAVRLTNDPAHADSPSWSPDGTRLAFVSWRTGNADIWIMDTVPSSEPLQLTSEGYPGASISSSGWSPDGSRIVYSAVVSDDPLTAEIRTVPSAGGPSELLVGGPGANSYPAWSPDGTQIAFASDPIGNLEIWVIPASGGEAVQLTNDPGRDWRPVWSPDGSRIAFSSDRTGNQDLWVMSSTGENVTQLTFGPAQDVPSSWSPDGSRISFRSAKDDRVADVWVLYLR